MSASPLIKFLWKQHKLVYLSPAIAVDFELLDVLVKIKEEGIIRQHPLLQRIGSIFGIAGINQLKLEEGAEEEEEEGEAEEEEVSLKVLQEELQKLRSNGSSDFSAKYIHTFFHGRWTNMSGVSTGLEGSAIEVSAVGVGGGAGQVFSIDKVESERVDITALAKCLSSETNPWTPNIDYIRQWCAPRNKKELELWVVTKLFYHSGIQFGSTTELHAGVGIPTLPVKVGARWKKIREAGVDSSGTRLASAADDIQQTSWIPFAFQAIRLRYSLQDAKLTNPSFGMGTAIPRCHRGGGSAWPLCFFPKVEGGEDVIIDPDDQSDENKGELLDRE